MNEYNSEFLKMVKKYDTINDDDSMGDYIASGYSSSIERFIENRRKYVQKKKAYNNYIKDKYITIHNNSIYGLTNRVNAYIKDKDTLITIDSDLNITKFKRIPIEGIGAMSDGYHTFDDLYYQRLVLFATIVNNNPDISWKSYKHEDGKLCFGGGWFIVGIDTPEGSYTYHYENKYFDMFKCKELETAKHWDGHTDKDVTRLLSINKEKQHNPYIPKGNMAELRAKSDEFILIQDIIRKIIEFTYTHGMNGSSTITIQQLYDLINIMPTYSQIHDIYEGPVVIKKTE